MNGFQGRAIVGGSYAPLPGGARIAPPTGPPSGAGPVGAYFLIFCFSFHNLNNFKFWTKFELKFFERNFEFEQKFKFWTNFDFEQNSNFETNFEFEQNSNFEQILSLNEIRILNKFWAWTKFEFWTNFEFEHFFEYWTNFAFEQFSNLNNFRIWTNLDYEPISNLNKFRKVNKNSYLNKFGIWTKFWIWTNFKNAQSRKMFKVKKNQIF
jgi:hypothetical protein